MQDGSDGRKSTNPSKETPQAGAFTRRQAEAAYRRDADSKAQEKQVEPLSRLQGVESQAVERSREAGGLNAENHLDRSTEINEAPERTSVSPQDAPILLLMHLYEQFKAEKEREELEASTSRDQSSNDGTNDKPSK